jgi:hypothetical protein
MDSRLRALLPSRSARRETPSSSRLSVYDIGEPTGALD